MKLKELTPAEYICSDCKTCPAVFESDRDTYVIIGKKLSEAEYGKLAERIASDEFVIEVPKGMIDKIKI